MQKIQLGVTALLLISLAFPLYKGATFHYTSEAKKVFAKGGAIFSAYVVLCFAVRLLIHKLCC